MGYNPHPQIKNLYPRYHLDSTNFPPVNGVADGGTMNTIERRRLLGSISRAGEGRARG